MPDLRQLHQSLTDSIEALAELTSRPAPDEAALATERYRLSRLSGERRGAIEALCTELEGRLAPAEAGRLRPLREESGAARLESSAHVSGWSLRDVVADWPGYCAASAQMRRSMLDQIEREKRLLYPHLGSAAEPIG
ncbi:hypothetical protein [Sphingomonas sp. S2-65]|uniref:hypothetical protein n=1 Tax=Sphingomonas sp. S2-65 TaxID=2903960 RepID=UPI001F2C06BE|nr:hypothetical protein [Sphingomonas sp. S2-65]UYY59108.1 hypothetical protein LZ586_03135 [Sphingomonas sp. S2-65]